jgi:hypothetical protein
MLLLVVDTAAVAVAVCLFVCLLHGSSTKSFPFFLSSFFPLSF